MGEPLTNEFKYNDWAMETTWDGRTLICKSSGSSKKTSDRYSLNKVTGVSASVTGGYCYWDTYPSWDTGSMHGVSIGTTLYVNIYLVKEDGTRASYSSATGGVYTKGETQAYAGVTTGTCSYPTANPSITDTSDYKYLEVEYTVSSTNSQCSIEKAYDGTGAWDGKLNPSGTSEIKVKTTVPVKYNESDELDAVKYGTTELSHLKYEKDGTTISIY